MLAIPVPFDPPVHTTDGSGPWWLGFVLIAVLVVGYALYTWRSNVRFRRRRWQESSHEDESATAPRAA